MEPPKSANFAAKCAFLAGLRGLIAGYTIKSWWSVHPQSIVNPYIYKYNQSNKG
jgi:hypothetical protein